MNPEFSRLGVLAVMIYCGLLVATVPPLIPVFALLVPWSFLTGVLSDALVLIFFTILNGVLVYVITATLDPTYTSTKKPLI